MNGEINSPRLIENVIEDINIMAKDVRNIKFHIVVGRQIC